MVLLTLCVGSSADAVGFKYNLDGAQLSLDEKIFVYDSACRITEVWSNDVKIVENKYDFMDRRVMKITPDEVHTFIYDDWLLMRECIDYGNGRREAIDYYWGKDLSGTLYGANGVGGLICLAKGSAVYVPMYGVNGNVIAYVDSHGTVVAEYVYDAFGNTISKRGSMADSFSLMYSTKYYDRELGLYYYGKRYYCPKIGRWMSRDPIGEEGGANLYQFCGNSPVNCFDPLGMKIMVLKNLVGRVPPGGWGDCGRNVAQTQYNEPKVYVREVRRENGKIGFSVKIDPAVSPVTLYFKDNCFLPLAVAHEMEHVSWIEKYDDAIERFKKDVESIVDCPKRARERFACFKRLLDKRKAYIVNENNKLDAPGGPHGH